MKVNWYIEGFVAKYLLMALRTSLAYLYRLQCRLTGTMAQNHLLKRLGFLLANILSKINPKSTIFKFLLYYHDDQNDELTKLPSHRK